MKIRRIILLVCQSKDNQIQNLWGVQWEKYKQRKSVMKSTSFNIILRVTILDLGIFYIFAYNSFLHFNSSFENYFPFT